MKTTPKDFFLHVLSMVTLYASATSFLILIFQYTNTLIPDPLNYEGRFQSFGAIRWSLSTLLVVFPVYLAIMWWLNKIYAQEPEIRKLWIRRWLVYFTLFAAALIIIGDVVALINRLLEGELTLRFLIKVLAILSVAGTVFGYYIWDLRSWPEHKKGVKIFAYIISVVVLITVAAGFFIVGSPQQERLRRFDDRRVSDLQYLQSETVFYWQNKGRLPEKLEDLRDALRGVSVPNDPETGTAYLYEARGPETFALCADFALPSAGREVTAVPKPVGPREFVHGESWEHEAGRVCFERTIDKEFFKPLLKQF